MLEKIRSMKKDNKGFTLVELIVVLVILAILAALLIPALSGYIEKAKEKQIIAETRQAVMAAQTIADEKTAKLGAGKYCDTTAIKATDVISEIQTLAEVSGTISDITLTDKGVVDTLKYTNGQSCTYTKEITSAGEHYTVK